MRAITVIAIAAIVATGFASLYMKVPVASQAGFRELLRRFFAFAKLLASGGIPNEFSHVDFTNRETFLSVWLLSFIPVLFACACIAHKWFS